ncbi:unnamed protein product [Rotaria socialis]|uniref:N-acetyltransferase domain-containing protein n=1 Tax=Rotaria socialis TaxID=392032 RepID=A0A817XR75_9BILA|nr:unnamed protein product [Rotaria socialis]CAF4791883.1 unnamed protein product [Rotaria socialis]
MTTLLSRNITKFKTNSSNIRIYHNGQYPLEDIANVLYSVFHLYSSYESIIEMINISDHIFFAFDQIQHRCVAGAILSNSNPKGGLYLKLFGVRKSSQHRGLGTKLLTAIIQWAYQTRHKFIYLHVHVKNFKAIGLYEKVGFRKVEYIPDYYNQTPKDKPDAFRMTLILR